MTDTNEPNPPRGFAERLQRMCGETAYRMPVEGRSTRPGSLPAAHQLAAALGMARAGRDDVGPDIVMDVITGRTSNAPRVVRTVADAMCGDRNRAAARCRPWMRVIVWAAYATLVGGMRQDQLRPDEVSAVDWDLLTEAAERVMGRLADEALGRAERAFHAEGQRVAA